MRVHVNFFGPGSIAYLHYNIFWKLLNFLYFNGVSCVRDNDQNIDKHEYIGN